MWKKISFGVFLAVSVIGIVYWLTYVREIKAPVSDPIHAVPTDAAFIFESNQIKNTWNKLSHTNIMWEELLGTKTFAELDRQATYMDSLIQLDPSVSALLEEHPILISAHATGLNTFSFLFTYSLPNLTHNSIVENFSARIRGNKSSKKYEYNGISIEGTACEVNKEIYFSMLNGTIMISFEKKLVEASIAQLQSGTTLVTNSNFSKVIDAAGQKADASLYINYKYFPGALGQFFSSDISGISSFAEYSGWDITLKPNALMLNGFTYVNDSAPSFLSSFNKQKPQEIELTKIIPSSTSLMVYYGVSNMETFHSALQNYLSSDKSSIKKFEAGLEKTMLNWMNNEFAMIRTEGDTTEYAYAVIRANNIEEALEALTRSSSDSIAANPDSSRFSGYTIKCLGQTGILSSLFGSVFDPVQNNYYTSIEDYIVFANNAEALEEFINEFESNKVLAEDRNYKAFSENLSAEANLYIYSSIARSGKIIASHLSKELAKELELKTELLSKFEAGALQFSRNSDSYYSNAFFNYNPESKKETATLWELKMDTTINSKPFLLVNHNSKAKEILVQDDANTIHLISNTGKVLWTKQLHEKIMSNVIQVDVLKNDKLQMVFNTRSFIYMFDRNGNDMKGFPVKLKSPATNAISVIDYENNRDYRIFLAQENKSILCFKPNGERVDGFKFERTKEPVYLPIQYFNAAGKDHLCAIDMKGNIYILNRQGEVRVKLKEQMAQGIRNFFVEPGKDYNRTYILAADTLGNIFKIGLTGEKENIKMQDFETSPYFDYRDLQNDKTKEYIFLTRKELKVFSQDRSLLFRHEFKDLVSTTPILFLFPDGRSKIGVVSEASNELFLFNDNGSVYDGFPLNGRTQFSIGDLNNEGRFNLITGSSFNSIFAYSID